MATLTQPSANWADRGVRVNAIAPGWFKSELTMGLIRNKTFRQRLNSNAPMGRIGNTEELAESTTAFSFRCFKFYYWRNHFSRRRNTRVYRNAILDG